MSCKKMAIFGSKFVSGRRKCSLGSIFKLGCYKGVRARRRLHGCGCRCCGKGKVNVPDSVHLKSGVCRSIGKSNMLSRGSCICLNSSSPGVSCSFGLKLR